MQRRRNYLIKKGFQVNFSLSFIVLLVLGSALIWGLFMNISGDTLTTGLSDMRVKVATTDQFFFSSFLYIIGIVAIGTTIAGMVVFILLSHRIAGPIYRVEKTLEAITGGDLTTRVNLRRTDQVVELKESLNHLVETMDRKMSRIKKSLAEIGKIASSTKCSPQEASTMDQAIKSLKEDMEFFRVSSDDK